MENIKELESNLSLDLHSEYQFNDVNVNLLGIMLQILKQVLTTHAKQEYTRGI